MNTNIRQANDAKALKEARRLLRKGEVVAFPTDTVYGVGAHAFDANGVRRLFEVKERPPQMAIPVLLQQPRDVSRVAVDIPNAYWVLAERFWPGGLTLVLKARADLPAVLLAGGATVAVRVPDHPTPLELAALLGAPLAATSANISGRPPPTTAQQVLEQLGERIPLILDGGVCKEGVPSTVIDLTVSPPRLLRAGALPIEAIRQALPALADAEAKRT